MGVVVGAAESIGPTGSSTQSVQVCDEGRGGWEIVGKKPHNPPPQQQAVGG